MSVTPGTPPPPPNEHDRRHRPPLPAKSSAGQGAKEVTPRTIEELWTRLQARVNRRIASVEGRVKRLEEDLPEVAHLSRMTMGAYEDMERAKVEADPTDAASGEGAGGETPLRFPRTSFGEGRNTSLAPNEAEGTPPDGGWTINYDYLLGVWKELRRQPGEYVSMEGIEAVLLAVERLQPAYPQPRTVSEEEWQPIDTAPEDGTRVLLWMPGYRDPVRIGYRTWRAVNEWRRDPDAFPYDVPATHWMPLPDPPITPTEEPADEG